MTRKLVLTIVYLYPVFALALGASVTLWLLSRRTIKGVEILLFLPSIEA